MKRAVLFITVILSFMFFSACSKESTETSPPVVVDTFMPTNDIPSDIEESVTPHEKGTVFDDADGVLIQEDEFISISYLGCEIYSDDFNYYNEETMAFYLINKTEYEINVLFTSFSIDNKSMPDFFISDNYGTLAPNSEGIFRCKNLTGQFPTLTPSTISGALQISIEDDDNSWYKASFSQDIVENDSETISISPTIDLETAHTIGSESKTYLAFSDATSLSDYNLSANQFGSIVFNGLSVEHSNMLGKTIINQDALYRALAKGLEPKQFL